VSGGAQVIWWMMAWNRIKDMLRKINETLKIRGIFDKAITTMVLDD